MQPDGTPHSLPLSYAALVLVGCCLLSSGRLLWKAPRPGRLNDPNQVAQRSDERFAALKSALPRTGVVGYIGAPGAMAVGDYYLAQYALAPLVVDRSTDHALVVGNFPGSSISLPEGLEPVRNFGNGVYLFANKGPK
jgi:hypothetical protein